MKTSIFEIFKIGIGPSSSHTVGPMLAALDFCARLESGSALARTARVRTDLYGSLALTGLGHGTDRAILVGLSGEKPDVIAPEAIDPLLEAIRTKQILKLAGKHAIRFEEPRDLLFHRDRALPAHPNGMRFEAFDSGGAPLRSQVYYSIGGGFIEREGENVATKERNAPALPFSSAAELLAIGEQRKMAIWEVALLNEQAWHTENDVLAYVRRIWSVMQECVKRGLASEGILPGGLNVRRRARRLAEKLEAVGGAIPWRRWIGSMPTLWQ